MTTRAGTLTVALLVACSSSAPAGPGFMIAVSDEPVVIEEEKTALLPIVVLGTTGESVTVRSPDLPGFATLSGNVLTLSPRRGDAGDYDVTLTAKAGAREHTAILRLRVTRSAHPNTAPTFLPQPMIQDASRSIRAFGGATVVGTPYILAMVCDVDADPITLDVEVVPAGQAFAGIPTHSFTVTPTPVNTSNGACAEIFSPLNGLAVPGAYDVRLRLEDALGLSMYGWVPLGGFTLAP